MMPNDAAKETTPSSTRPRLPSQSTTKKMLIAMAVVYGFWLLWMGYVAWVNVQAGNQ